jgi:hypothetical protein
MRPFARDRTTKGRASCLRCTQMALASYGAKTRLANKSLKVAVFYLRAIC